MDGSLNSVAVFLVALVPVLIIGAVVTDLLLANAPRRGKRPDVACRAAAPFSPPGRAGGRLSRAHFARWWPIGFQGVLGLSAVVHSLVGRPTWPAVGSYVVGVVGLVVVSRVMARRSVTAASDHAGQIKK